MGLRNGGVFMVVRKNGCILFHDINPVTNKSKEDHDIPQFWNFDNLNCQNN